jgi:hypothetical protein
MARFLTSPNFRRAFYVAAAFAVVMALLPQPPYTPTREFGDKVEHIIAFAILAALANLGFPEAAKRTVVERLSFLGAAIEVMQSIPALHRDCEPLDWLADTLAVAAVTLGFALWRRNRARAA